MSEVLLRHAVELAWRQWTALGVRGVAPAPRYPVDVEALIAFTPFVAARDPRLDEETRDWCARIGPDFVSVSRLRQLLKLIGEVDGADKASIPHLFLRNAIGAERLTMKSRAPDLAHPALLQLRARCVFGVGTRADVLARLVVLEQSGASIPASTIRPSGCTKQAVASVLAQLVRARLLRPSKAGAATGFQLVRGEALRGLLDPIPYAAVDWSERFASVALILQTWRRYGTRATYGIELMKVLAATPSLRRRSVRLPRLAGRPPEIVLAVEQWALGLLDDEAWETEWLLQGEDIAHEIQARIYDDIVAAVQAAGYPVGFTTVDDLSFQKVDRAAGTAEFSVRFSGDHPREDWTFPGHVDGTLTFSAAARRKPTFLDSIEVTRMEVRFALEEEE